MRCSLTRDARTLGSLHTCNLLAIVNVSHRYAHFKEVNSDGWIGPLVKQGAHNRRQFHPVCVRRPRSSRNQTHATFNFVVAR